MQVLKGGGGMVLERVKEVIGRKREVEVRDHVLSTAFPTREHS